MRRVSPVAFRCAFLARTEGIRRTVSTSTVRPDNLSMSACRAAKLPWRAGSGRTLPTGPPTSCVNLVSKGRRPAWPLPMGWGTRRCHGRLSPGADARVYHRRSAGEAPVDHALRCREVRAVEPVRRVPQSPNWKLLPA